MLRKVIRSFSFLCAMSKNRLFPVLAVMIWPASAFVQTCFWDAGSTVRRLRGGSGGGGPRMSAYPTIDLNDGTKHPMVCVGVCVC